MYISPPVFSLPSLSLPFTLFLSLSLSPTFKHTQYYSASVYKSTSFFSLLLSLPHSFSLTPLSLFLSLSLTPYLTRACFTFLFFPPQQLARPIFELFRMSAEMLRIGAGNARPYLTLYSSRNLSCYELYLGLAKSNLTDPSTLFYVLDNLRPMPWLQCQMILIILSKQFLYKTPSLMIGGHARKVKLSVRLILEVFLMGEVNLFQKHQFEQMKKIREVGLKIIKDRHSFHKRFS